MNSIMWKYIDEEPSCIEKLLNSKEVLDAAANVIDYDALYFVAHGSSYNAAITVHDFFSRVTGKRAYAYTPSSFINSCFSLNVEKKPLVVAISETGTSRGLIEAVEHAEKEKISVLSITDTANSPIEKLGTYVLHMQCGKEDSNAKTKGYTNTLVALILLATEIGYKLGKISDTDKTEIRNEIAGCANQIPSLKNLVLSRMKELNFGRNLTCLYVLGSGMNYGTAMEGQLKMMETMCVPTAFNDIGEFSHGMHRSVSNKIDSIVIDTGTDHIDAIKAWNFLCDAGRSSILITSDDSYSGNNVINISRCKFTNSVLLTTLVIQVISVFTPENNGLDPNRPSHNELTETMETRV